MLLYKDEHLSCFNYETERNPTLRIIQKTKGEQVEGDINDTVFAFFISGQNKLSYGKYLNQDVPEGKIVLFPPGTHYKISVVEETLIVILRIKGILQLCECMSIEKLIYEGKPPMSIIDTEKPGMLDINEDIHLHIANMCKHFAAGLKCVYYVETKTKELFFLLRAYYEKEKLSRFFSPILSSNARFTFFVYKNYRKVKNLQELITLSSYSESTFKKNFKKSFGVPASTWLRKQKATFIFRDLNNPTLSIKEICNKYHFAAVSSFSAFCMQNFGKPPGKIRTLARKAENSDINIEEIEG